jgi:hypothetical protein
MNITTSITGDCRFISIGISGATAQGSLTININNLDIFPATATASGTYSTARLLASTVGTQAGIFQITVTEGSTSVYSGELGKCELDCCIAKKVDSLLGCDCECTRCSGTLETANRVMLLIQAIETDLSQIGGDVANNTAIYTNANAKYNKALELCSDSCGCNC